MNLGNAVGRSPLVLAIALGLTCPSLVLATDAPAAAPSVQLAGIDTHEAPRVTAFVDFAKKSVVEGTHLDMASAASQATPLNDSVKLAHLQLVLKPSAQRQAALETLSAQQHDPSSPNFHKWLTPAQFGTTFGVADADIAAVTSWMRAQGLTVNAVYPNKTQIDFTGTVAQIRAAFGTNEVAYTIGGKVHRSNDSNISVPTALKPVIAGVMGLNDNKPMPQHIAPRLASFNAQSGMFQLAANAAKAPATSASGVHTDAVQFPTAARGLVPGDISAMYGIDKLRAAGFTGKGVTIAVVDVANMVDADYANFMQTFHLDKYNGSFTQINPAPPSGPTNCLDPNTVDNQQYDFDETLLDVEWSAAVAPAAHIVAAICSDADAKGNATTTNFFGGAFIASANLVNASASRPDIISVSYGYGEDAIDLASKQAIDAMWAQADAEGISVFVSSGDSGSNPDFNGGLNSPTSYQGARPSAVSANAFGTSSHVTVVGGNDTADVLDNTTSKYFRKMTDPTLGTALGYVPEIPWNQSCGNEVAAKSMGFNSTVKFCQQQFKFDPNGVYATSEAGSGGPSGVVRKPSWQKLVYNAQKDQSRDVPDVSLFAGAYGAHTWVVVCTAAYPCTSNFSGPVSLSGGTSLAAPMFAGIQALVDQKLAGAGRSQMQGNAAPTLYALAAKEYGSPTSGPTDALKACNADNGNDGTQSCVFHNVTRGSIATNCAQGLGDDDPILSNCYFVADLPQYNTGLGYFPIQIGLTSMDANPQSYSAKTEAFAARPGWSFASGLGSVNATNLANAWLSYTKK